MGKWPVQEAKARFSELVERCIAEGPQLVTKRGVEVVVLVSAAEWHRLQASARPTLKELLLDDDARTDVPVPSRGARHRRTPSALG